MAVESNASSVYIKPEKKFLKELLDDLEFFQESDAYNEQADYNGSLEDMIILVRSRIAALARIHAMPV